MPGMAITCLMNSFARASLIRIVVLVLLFACCAPAQPATIGTFAGAVLTPGSTAASARLYGPVAVAVDAAGNVFFLDGDRLLRADATSGSLSVVAGNGTPGF